MDWKARMVQEINEFPHFLNRFFGQYLKLTKQHPKDSGALQLHADTLFVFITFPCMKIFAILLVNIFLHHPVEFLVQDFRKIHLVIITVKAIFDQIK